MANALHMWPTHGLRGKGCRPQSGAVRATGKKTLIIAGVWTSVCVMFPALDAKAAGFKVYAVMDASGDPSELASRTTLARFTQAGRHSRLDECGAV
jgi:nicotinamidase-related amidase